MQNSLILTISRYSVTFIVSKNEVVKFCGKIVVTTYSEYYYCSLSDDKKGILTAEVDIGVHFD